MKVGDKVRLKTKHAVGKRETAKIETVTPGGSAILSKKLQGRLHWPTPENYLEVVKDKDAGSTKLNTSKGTSIKKDTGSSLK